MKKSFMVMLTLFSATAIANENNTRAADQIDVAKAPKLILEVYDNSNKVPKHIEGRKYSISKKAQQLCWTAFNMPFSPNNGIKEIFISPKKAKFMDKNSVVVPSKDGKMNVITAMLPSHNNEFIQRCWSFDKNDPLGTYQLKVFVNDIEFPQQKFELVK